MSDNQEIRFARLERAPAYKNVSEAILKDIIDGRLTVGNRLPSEQKLAEQFGVHRSTVREGIRLLEETGVLRRANSASGSTRISGATKKSIRSPLIFDLLNRTDRPKIVP
jgi:DNA-binding FadR family transcriptional regulator